MDFFTIISFPKVVSFSLLSFFLLGMLTFPVDYNNRFLLQKDTKINNLTKVEFLYSEGSSDSSLFIAYFDPVKSVIEANSIAIDSLEEAGIICKFYMECYDTNSSAGIETFAFLKDFDSKY